MKKYKWQIIAGSVAALVLLVLIVALVRRINRNKRTYENFDVIGDAVLFEETSEVHYLPAAKGVFRYTRDGATLYDKKGRNQGSFSYNMNKPSGDTCGHAATVGEIGGRALVIMDNEGTVNNVSTPYPIVKVQVASQGVTAVWMNDGKQDFFQIYDASGEMLVDMETIVTTSGFPVDFAISNDGTKLVTAFVNFKEETMTSQVSFYNFGKVGDNLPEGLVGSMMYKGEMIADVAFANNNTVVAFGDSVCRIYDMEEVPDLKSEIKADAPIHSVAFSDTYVGMVVESNAKGGNFISRIYDLSGKLVDEKGMTNGYNGFLIDKGDVIFFNESELYIYRVGGHDKIKVELHKSMKYVAFVGEPNEYVFVGDDYLERVKLVGDK